MTSYTKKPNFKNPYTLRNKFVRFFFNIIWALFVRPFPGKLSRKWAIFILNSFGANVHPTSVIYSSSKILMPWNLIMHENSCIANNVIVENSDKIVIGAYSIISQYSYLCTASHDFRDIDFPQFSKPIIVGEKCWVCANSFIGPGVKLGDGSIVGASSSVFKNVDEWQIVGGNPARNLGQRIIKD